MILRIDHISIAVRDFQKAENFFNNLLGLVPGGSGSDKDRGFFYHIYSAGDLSRFELISPDSDQSFLKGFLKKRDGGVHHITFQVDSVYRVRQELEKHNIPYFGFNDRYKDWKELFIHPKEAYGVLIQFAEFAPENWLDESMNVRHGKKWTVEKNDGEIKFSIAHPGGGKVDILFNDKEIDDLISELTKMKNL